jgi:hypothetical protein
MTYCVHVLLYNGATQIKNKTDVLFEVNFFNLFVLYICIYFMALSH